MKNKESGFTLIEMLVALAVLGVVTTTTVPIISRSRWQGEVDRYALLLESGLYQLRAKLATNKTSCKIDFPAAFKFFPPEDVVEFNQNSTNNSTKFMCCDSVISELTSDPDCENGYAGDQISNLTGRARDNLRLAQIESTPASRAVVVATSNKDFGFTPPGMTANSGTLTFLICHNRSISGNNCLPKQNRINMRCVQIDGTGAIANGTWQVTTSSSPVSTGSCNISR